MMRYAPTYVPTDDERDTLNALLDELLRDNAGEDELALCAYAMRLAE